MDAIEILGSLLGQKSSSSSGGLGTKILKDILGGGSRPQLPQQHQPTRTRDDIVIHGPADIERSARELEDLLNVAHKRSQNSEIRSSQGYTKTTPNQNTQWGQQSQGQGRAPTTQAELPNATRAKPQCENEQAVILIRAMIHASKADGKVTQQEQQTIFEQIGDTSPETIQFLQNEFAQNVDVKDFVWSVPMGMEQQVYTMSLVGMQQLDTQTEAKYLGDLAFGLRLSPDICNAIHRRVGAPQIFN